MKLDDVIFISSLPTIDLHGYDRDFARIKVLEFINDNKKLKNELICIIHGIGSGILKNEVHKVLKSHKDILNYKIYYNNNGCTIAQILVNK